MKLVRPSLRELTHSLALPFDSINPYLHGFEDHIPEAAMALQTLAESAAEAQIAVKDRSDRN